MKTIFERRLENARALMRQNGGGPTRFSERMSAVRYMSKQQASHIVGENPLKNIGDEMARRIEDAFEMKRGWLDEDHDAPPSHDPELIEVSLIASAVGLSDVAQAVRLRKAWVRQNLTATAFEHLGILTNVGDAMTPTIGDGSVLLVDQGVTSLHADGVYALAKDRNVFVRRVQRRLEGGIIIKCDNPSYESSVVEDHSKAGILVLGRVLLAWCGSKL